MSENQLRISNLGETLGGLKEEKSALLERLRKLKQRRQNLEKTLNEAETKYMGLKDNHDKMQEALRMTKCQVEEVHSQALHFEGTNKLLKKDINDLNDSLENEHEVLTSERQQFEDELKTLAKAFREEKKFHEPQQLDEECENVIKETEIANETSAKIENEIRSLNDKIKQLSNNDMIYPELQNLYISVKDAKKGAKNKLKEVESEEKLLQEKTEASEI